MAITSISDRVATLLDKPLVSERVGGRFDTGLEGAAVGDLIGVTLAQSPRAVLYLVHLARNGLLAQINATLSAIDEMISSAEDLSNPKLMVRGTSNLTEVRSILLRMEGSGVIDPSNHLFTQLRNSVSRVLNKDLGPAVRRGGKFTRPSDEALSDLTEAYSALKSLYPDVIDRASAIPVAADNFTAARLQRSKAASVAVRLRADLEEVLAELEAEGEAPASRDLALTLISGRSTLEHVGTETSYLDPVLSTSLSLPVGHTLSAETEKTAATLTLSPGPYSLPSGATVGISVNGGPSSTFSFPQSTYNVSAMPSVVGSAKVWPITVPAGSNQALLFSVNGAVKVVPLSAGTYSLLQIRTAINNASLGLRAEEYVRAGTNRLLVAATAGTDLRVLTSHSVSTGTPAVNPTSYTTTTYTSRHDLFGFSGDEYSTSDLPVARAVEALNLRFSDLLTASAQADGSILLTGKSTSLGSSLAFSGPTIMGGTKSATAVSGQVRLFGKVFGETLDPASPVGLVSVGQTLTLGGNPATISRVTETGVTVSPEIPTGSGSVTITSPLVVAHSNLVVQVSDFLASWRLSRFAAGLSVVDRAVAACISTKSPAQQADLVGTLSELRSLMVSLQASLTGASTQFPRESAESERSLVNGILETLRQRGMDRASDYLLKAKILEGCTLNGRSASYSGDLELSMIDLARNDIAFPNRAADEGWETKMAGPEA